jgi:hypothetical protein
MYAAAGRRKRTAESWTRRVSVLGGGGERGEVQEHEHEHDCCALGIPMLPADGRNFAERWSQQKRDAG